MEAIPLFPLGTVLFPGVVLPLHIFEPRYRELVRQLMAAPEGPAREFGVVSIRQGWEVGKDGVTALYDVGCTAELRQVSHFGDGSYDIVSVGRRRFRLLDVDDESAPYLSGSVEWIPDEPYSASEAAVLATGVAEIFRRYIRLVAATNNASASDAAGASGHAELDLSATALAGLSLPDDPEMLSHLVAASAPLPQADRQRLLAEPSTVPRLRRELRLLKREATMLRRLAAVPVPLAELRVPLSLN